MSDYFSGDARVYNEEFFIDANTGVGINRLLAKIDPLLFKMSRALYIPGYDQEDLKQELAIMAIEGVRSFNASKDVKLSTFLHIHLHNKIISKIKSKNKLSHNAFSVAEDRALPSVCDCGSANFKIIEKDGAEVSRECMECDHIYKKEIRIAKREVLFSSIKLNKADGDSETGTFTDNIESGGGVFNSGVSDQDRLEMSKSIDSVCSDLDKKTADILKLVIVDDYSIQDAADKLGISSWSANLRLKNLTKNKKIKEMLAR